MATPSISNKVDFLPILVFPILFLLTIFKIGDFDIWFHMKAGQVITETGGFLYKDIFTYTAEGREWIYHEWLFGVLAYNIYNIFGANGIIIGKAMVLTITFLIIYRCMRIRGVNPYIASIILFLAVLAARFRLTERPHIFKFLFVAAFIYLLDIYRLKKRNLLWFLPLIELFWVNIHGSFTLGPILIFVYLFSEVVKKERDAPALYLLASILILTSFATIINPYGLKLILFSLGFVEQPVLSVIGEWRHTQLIDLYGAFGFLIVGGAISFLPKYKEAKAVDVILFFIFSLLAIKAVRFVALFSLSVSPIIADNLHRHLTTSTKSKTWVLALIATVIFSIIFYHEVKRPSETTFGFGLSRKYPQEAVDFLKQRLPGKKGHLYNFSSFGGYLIWQLYPYEKVFDDGRPEIYDKRFQQALIIAPLPTNWKKAVDVYDINYAIVGYTESKVDRIASWISGDPQWVLIYWDDVAKIYIRDLPKNRDIIDRYGHRILTGATFNYNSFKKAIVEGNSSRLENEYKKDIESNSKNMVARFWLGRLYYEIGRREEALSAWIEAATIKPDAILYNNIGTLLQEKGEHRTAISYFQKALECDKRLAITYYNLAKSYESLGQKEHAASAVKRFIEYAGPEYNDLVISLK